MDKEYKDFLKTLNDDPNQTINSSEKIEKPLDLNTGGIIGHVANENITDNKDFHNLLSNPRNKSDSMNIQHCTMNLNMLKSWKINLEDALKSLNYLKTRIVENIQAKNKEQNNLLSTHEKLKHDEQPLQSNNSVIPKINVSNSLFNNANSYIEKYLEQNKTLNGKNYLEQNNVNNNSEKSTVNKKDDRKPLAHLPNNECNNPIELLNNISSMPQDIEVINLLSGDEGSNSDSDMVSNKSENVTNNNASSISHSEYSLNNTKTNPDFSNNEMNGVNQNIIFDRKSKTKERYSNDSDKQNVKKQKIMENDLDFSNKPKFAFAGIFYKVKLTNLHPRIKYANIATLLTNSGLNYVDILLVKHHNSRLSYAEISFLEPEYREKAVSLDQTLSYLGQKITISGI